MPKSVRSIRNEVSDACHQLVRYATTSHQVPVGPDRVDMYSAFRELYFLSFLLVTDEPKSPKGPDLPLVNYLTGTLTHLLQYIARLDDPTQPERAPEVLEQIVVCIREIGTGIDAAGGQANGDDDPPGRQRVRPSFVKSLLSTLRRGSHRKN